ncbi:IclR family transcriptional regulator [Pantoea sp. B65]|uniref:IclR family transcriptional regulator n=1 Tax=Pantoea sp. B65 TaxID=2813359 RepID=UPI0039B497BE
MRKRSQVSPEIELNDESVDRQFISALARGLSLLRFLTNGSTLGTTDLAKLSGLSNAVVSRLCYTLEQLNYMEYLPEYGKYRLGNACLSLGYLAMASDMVSHVARPLMLELAVSARTPVGIGIRQGGTMVQVAMEGAQDHLSLRQDIGSVSPIERTAMGNAYLAGLDKPQRDKLLNELLPTIPDAAIIHQQIEDNLSLYAEQGFCINDRTWHPHIRAVGVPLRLRDSGRVVAFNCGGIADFLTLDFLMNEVGPKLAVMVNDVQAILESQSPPT